MILIVEGANRTGKSTMIGMLQKMAENSGVEFQLYNGRINNNEHVGITPEGMFAYAKSVISDLLKEDTNEKLIVFDRFHISELVYGEAFRGYTNEYMLKVDGFLDLMDAKILYMKSNFEHVTDRHKALEYEALQNRFNEAFAKHFMCENVKIVSFDGKAEHERAELAKEVFEWALS